MTIEKELVERLRQGVYGDMYNIHQKAFESVLDSQGKPLELVEEEDEAAEEEYEFVEGEEDDEDIDFDDENVEFEMEEELEEETRLQDIEDIKPSAKKANRSGPYVEIEYETETTDSKQTVGN